VLCAHHKEVARQYDQTRSQMEREQQLNPVSAPRQPMVRDLEIGKPPRPLPPLPTVCPRCTAELLPATIDLYLQSVPAVRCPMCGYLTDQQMLQNRMDAEAERAVERMSA